MSKLKEIKTLIWSRSHLIDLRGQSTEYCTVSFKKRKTRKGENGAAKDEKKKGIRGMKSNWRHTNVEQKFYVLHEITNRQHSSIWTSALYIETKRRVSNVFSFVVVGVHTNTEQLRGPTVIASCMCSPQLKLRKHSAKIIFIGSLIKA